LARQLDLPLVTADIRLQRNLAASGITVHTLFDLFPDRVGE
jgi:predicted nucleic acid-binding protein